MLQPVPAARTFVTRFVKVITLVPATAVSVPPGQLSVGLGIVGGLGVAITSPEGRLSVMLIPEMEVSTGAITLILKRLACPGWTGLVWKVFVSPTGSVVEFTTTRSGLVLKAAWPMPCVFVMELSATELS